jgi:DNA-binding beta-propeller fold protein YncE
VANSDGPRGISGFTIGANGFLTEVAGSPFPNGGVSADTSPSSIAIDPWGDPWGQFVFVANSGGNNVSVYSIDVNGALTPITGSPFPRGGDSAAVDLTSRFLYVAGGKAVAAYRVSKIGALKSIAGSPFAVPGGASSIAISP